MAGGFVPSVIVLALGAGALGGPETLGFLLEFAGQSPVLDITICIIAMGMAAAHVLGAMLLARYVRKARAGAGEGGGATVATATDCFARMTLAMSVGVGVVITACLVAASGALGSAHLLVAVLGVICAASAAAPAIRPRLRVFGVAGNAGGPAPGARASERFDNAARTVCLVTGVSLAAVGLLVAPFLPSAGLEALRLFRGCANISVGVATATVLGTALLLHALRRA